MFSPVALRDLFRQMEWADALTWKAALSDSIRLDSVIQEKIRHLHRTQQFFMKVWRGEEVSYTHIEIPFDDELPLARRFHRDAAEHLAAVSTEQLSGSLVVPWAAYFAKNLGIPNPGPTTLGETMFQVTAHSTYHRGQINMRIRELGDPTPSVDYIAWLWLSRPAAEWPEVR